MSARLKIVFQSDDVVPPEQLAFIQSKVPEGFDFESVQGTNNDEERMAKLKDADVALLWRTFFPAKLIEAAPKLKMIQRLGQGLDRIDVETARARGIAVFNSGGANAITVAEHALTLMLAVYRRLPFAVSSFQSGRWLRWEVRTGVHELHGKTVGVVGIGNIGRRVAKLVRAFETRVLYYDVVRLPEEKERDLGVEYVPFQELLKVSDIVTLHVPLLPETRNMIDGGALELMKRPAVLINTCRGQVVDEPALIAALQAGQIAGAGLDVFAQEPLSPDNPLLKMENVVCTSHIAGGSVESDERRVEMCFENIARVMRQLL